MADDPNPLHQEVQETLEAAYPEFPVVLARWGLSLKPDLTPDEWRAEWAAIERVHEGLGLFYPEIIDRWRAIVSGEEPESPMAQALMFGIRMMAQHRVWNDAKRAGGAQ